MIVIRLKVVLPAMVAGVLTLGGLAAFRGSPGPRPWLVIEMGRGQR